MRESFQKEKVINITKSGEFLIWLVLLLVLVAFYSMGIIFKEKNDKNDYQIFIQDVDGLIVGSPVRLMGIEVGHVTKIKPVKDEVYVNFVIDNPDIAIPQGTSITVEFSGLAGSKSLELYLPQKGDYVDKSTPILQVMAPKRLHDAQWLLNEMFKKLDSIIYSTSSFGNKLHKEDLLLRESIGKPEDLGNFLKYSDSFLEDSDKKANEIRHKIEEFRSNVK